MIMREKIKVMKKQIPNSSNSFIFRKRYIHSKIPTDYPQNPWGFITVPIPIPYPYPWESPWESPYPRQPCQSLYSAATYVGKVRHCLRPKCAMLTLSTLRCRALPRRRLGAVWPRRQHCNTSTDHELNTLLRHRLHTSQPALQLFNGCTRRRIHINR